MSLLDFLSKKPLFYDVIDYSRMGNVYRKIKQNFSHQKTIHILGTNGKGSTGRFLALMLEQASYKVGHYSSPHVLEFNERIWINSKNCSYEELDYYHEKLLNILEEKDAMELSYFEYTTFLAMLMFHDCDMVVFEAGMGGEFDATHVFPKDLCILTPIDLDHETFLGNNIELIASTKIRAIQSDIILSTQPHEKSNQILFEYAKKNNYKVFDASNVSLSDEEKKYSKRYNLPKFLEENLHVAFCATKYLGLNVDFSVLPKLDLHGRLEKIKQNVWIDVAHNPLGANILLKHFENKKVVLVYNSFLDKDFKTFLKILFPIIERVECLFLQSQRALATEQIFDFLKENKIKISYFNDFNSNDTYLACGSFIVVEEILRRYSEK